MGKELKGLDNSAKHEPEEVRERVARLVGGGGDSRGGKRRRRRGDSLWVAFGVVIGWCLGQCLGGDGVGIGVVFGWLNEIGVCSSWV